MRGIREMDIDFYWDYANAVRETQGPAWRYDERKACGVNYHSSWLARLYDARHQAFRDYEREAKQTIAALGLDGSTTVIDMGCGTGAFAVHAARHYRKVYAVDVSRAMLRQARRKARKAGATNVEFHQAGFLTYEHRAGPADAAVAVLVLHHLPDFWKLVGLHRLASMLRPGGRCYLRDVVFSFDIAQHESHIERFISTMRQRMGLDGQAELETHVRQEYSTCDWIMRGMLERAGFQVDEATCPDEFFATYLCTKVE
jgi:putative AdoMet-dependent methyltransferase